MREDQLFLGIDIGSTTIKVVLMDEEKQVVYSRYRRHMSDVRFSIATLLGEMHEELGDVKVQGAMTGSGGMGISEEIRMAFVQEVASCTRTIEELIPKTDVAIELGGEDAKITYFHPSLEQRMNGTCAGGTGAFIDQMAMLLKTDASGLNDLAANHTLVYPIASRCGVFAKTDVQPLLNEGAKKEDIAVSIFQAVVNQTISGLACGKPIRGKVAFLGGPLHFLPQLRRRFIETLHLTPEEVIFPENSQLFVAMGAAYLAREEGSLMSLQELLHRVEKIQEGELCENMMLEPLFRDEKELQEFRARHGAAQIERGDLSCAKGGLFLGIDAGSTTFKSALMDASGALLYSFYRSNQGEPVEACASMLKELYAQLPREAYIANAAITGYGEQLIKAAMKVDLGEVETIAHYKAAEHFVPDVDFILDIGGQDMKAIKIKDKAVESIILNEACSSGCGSFLETFAHSLQISVEDFAKEALLAEKPMDLGSRCTVFMNSKVKQAQKEGAQIGDISAGLSYSVIKNALYKVIKIRRREEYGQHIVVQGGTFYNEAVLRAFEREAQVEVIRPDISGIMGAYGAAQIAKERCIQGHVSSILPLEELQRFSMEKSFRRCEKCTNHCQLTVSRFPDGRESISGNRCERGTGLAMVKRNIPNLMQYKYQRMFAYQSLPKEAAQRGSVGLPRVLNMYENYPLWHTFFTKLGFRVELSPKSTKDIYALGMETIPSEAACYPAKIVHGHIESLIKKGLRFIFYPSVTYENQEFDDVGNHYNCPVVNSYPEVVRNNMDNLRQRGILYKNPFLNLNDIKSSCNNLYLNLKEFGVSKKEVEEALEAAVQERSAARRDIRLKGEEALRMLDLYNMKGIVLAGRPYHIDPEINHGLADVVLTEDMAVFTEDSIAHLGELDEEKLRVVDQWAYHSRLYRAAHYVTKNPRLELIQLTSFGCGLDAVTSDQVAEILQSKGKIYTLIKIDEGSNLGAIRIRVRSLKAAVQEREALDKIPLGYGSFSPRRNVFTKEMAKKHTILCPQMSPIHFQFVEEAIRSEGYNFVVLPSVDRGAIEEGLKYVHNDACFPSIIVIGQMMKALKSGDYDINNTSLAITQTGGACRATNYVAFIRKALQDAGMGHVPVITLSLQGIENNPGFKLTPALGKKALMALLYGDLFMNVVYRTRPYEAVKGSVDALYEKWTVLCKEQIRKGSSSVYKKYVKQIVREFDAIPRVERTIPKVGIVGEILVKFHPTANNQLTEILEDEGVEVIMPDLMNFFLYSIYNGKFKAENMGFGWNRKLSSLLGVGIIEHYREPLREALRKSKHFTEPRRIEEIAAKADGVVSLGNQAGEGWLLTAEMMELIENGVENIACIQPFACLPNHITGRGVIKELRRRYPSSNIVAIDYDPGASEVNQVNRIKLMLTTAKRNLAPQRVLL